MKGLLCILLLLESFVLVVQQQVDGGLVENEISQEDRRQNAPQTDTQRAEALTDSQQYCPPSFPDIYTELRELTATVRALETRLSDAEKTAEQQTVILEELNKKTDEISKSQVEELREENRDISNLTQSQVEELRKEIRDREIAFSAALMQSGHGTVGPFTTDITLTYRNVLTNIGNAYNPITGIFTAPLKGAYMFQFSVVSFGQSYPSTATIMKNGENMVVAHGHQAQGVLNSSKGVAVILEVGDVVYVRLWANTRVQDNFNNHNTFSGYLLFPLGG